MKTSGRRIGLRGGEEEMLKRNRLKENRMYSQEE
jgi:hypothetical protein